MNGIALTPFQKFELGIKLKRAMLVRYSDKYLKVDEEYFEFRRREDLLRFVTKIVVTRADKWCKPWKLNHDKNVLCIKVMRHSPSYYLTYPRGWWQPLPKPWPR